MTFLEGKVLICQRPNRNGFLSGFEVLEVETDGVGNRLLVWFEPSLTLKSQYPERITQVESVSPFTSDLRFDSDKFLVGCGFGFKERTLAFTINPEPVNHPRTSFGSGAFDDQGWRSHMSIATLPHPSFS